MIRVNAPKITWILYAYNMHIILIFFKNQLCYINKMLPLVSNDYFSPLKVNRLWLWIVYSIPYNLSLPRRQSQLVLWLTLNLCGSMLHYYTLAFNSLYIFISVFKNTNFKSMQSYIEFQKTSKASKFSPLLNASNFRFSNGWGEKIVSSRSECAS